VNRAASLLNRNWDRFLVGGVWAFFFLGVPFSAMEGDSGWFYMAVHYLETGTYRYGTGMTAFNGPCLYHNPFGYPALIALTKQLGGSGWPILLQLIQGAAYLGAYEACRRLYEIASGKARPVVLPVIYVAQFTTIEYSNYVMSECVSGFFISVSACLLAACLCDREGGRPGLRVWLGLCAAEVVFLKTVCLPIMIAACAWLPIPAGRRRKLEVVPGGILVVLILASMSFNLACFNRFALKGNWGWNIFNRVVHTDGKLNPEGAVTRATMELTGMTITRDWFWWDLEDALGRKGFSLDETSTIAEVIAREGIATYPLGFAFGTFTNGYRLAILTDAISQVRPDLDSWRRSQEALRRSQGAYLLDQLLAAWPAWRNRFTPICSFYAGFDRAFRSWLGFLLANAAWIGIYLWALARPPFGRRESGMRFGFWLILAIPGLVILGSAASEHIFIRYKVPVMPLLHTVAILKLASILPMTGKCAGNMESKEESKD